MMAFMTGNQFLQALVDKGLIPDDTISIELRARWDDLPILTVERAPEKHTLENFIDSIGSTEEIERADQS